MKFLVINGPNLNLLGTREPDIYGFETLADLESQWRDCADSLGIELATAQSNSEGALIDVIHAARGAVDGIILNAGALTHYSLALADALTAVDIPYVEVHISNIHEREEWRHHSVLSEGAHAVIVGRGTQGYLDAITHLHASLTHPATTVTYGTERQHEIDLRVPEGEAPHPGVIIVHGGYWRNIWLRDLMDRAAVDLTAQGFVTYNIEYTTGGNSYPAALEDIVAAFDFVVEHGADQGLDSERLVVIGHSAGGYLALHLAEARTGFAGVIALGSVVDLDMVSTDYPSNNPVDLFLGGSRHERPDTWEAASLRGTPQVPVSLIHGSDDEFVTPAHAERYLQMTRGSAELTILGGVGHMALIDPDDDAWRTVSESVTKITGS